MSRRSTPERPRAGGLARAAIVVALGASVVGGCAGRDAASSDDRDGSTPANEGREPPPIDPSTAGAITVRVSFEGTKPAPETFDMRKSDETCCRGRDPFAVVQPVLVNPDGSLANAFVWVKSGLEGRTFEAAAETLILDQKGCEFAPHVFGIRRGQRLRIVNSDPTLHNVHARSEANPAFNIGMPVPGEFIRRFEKPEVMIEIRCNVHEWMSAYAGVVDHPYFGVTKEAGVVELAPLPPGDYTLGVWHETLGAREQLVTVGAKESLAIEMPMKGKP